jgi:hypothetical protein
MNKIEENYKEKKLHNFFGVSLVSIRCPQTEKNAFVLTNKKDKLQRKETSQLELRFPCISIRCPQTEKKCVCTYKQER